jgi:DNA-directed RNA polymerase specialized sigma24 family protein
MNNHEKSIIEGIRSGLKDAENTLYLLFKNKLEKALRKYCFSTIPFEMVVTDAIMITIEKIRADEYQDHGKLLPYMIGIGKNICSEIHKKNVKEIVKYDDLILNCAHNSVENEGHQAFFDENIGTALEALNKIDKICRELLILALYKQLKPKDIIKIMPELVSASRISNRKNKCYEKLREKFNKLKSR